MNIKTIMVVAAIVVILGTGYAIAGTGGFWNGMMGYGNGKGMMGNSGMMGNGSMMGEANGLTSGSKCSAATPDDGANAAPITIDGAKTSVEKYLAGAGNTDLEVK